ncbi:MAG: two-component system NarL family sensor kinase [Cyclobacteriaceae bacterium]|jgi:two-component system NarL family sensor kinase
MVKILTISFLIGTVSLYAQKLPNSAQKFGLDTMSLKSQVSYITENFYEIYSKGFDESIALSDYALKIAVSNEWQDKVAYSLMCNGIANYLSGNYEEALRSFLESSDLFDSLDHYKGIAEVNNELSVFYRKQNDLEKVFTCLNKSEKAAKRINDLTSLGTSYHHRGVVLSQSGKIEKAIPYFEKVLAIRTELEDSVGLGYIYLDFAEYESSKGNIEAALDYIEKSTAIRRKTGDSQGVAVNEVIKGEVQFTFEKHDQAVLHFNKAIELAEPLGFTDLIQYSYDMLRQSYLQMNNHKMAYESFEKSAAIKDSLFSSEKTKSLQELQTKYETEKKEQQIALQTAQLKTNQLITTGLLGIIALLIAIGFMQKNRLMLKQQKILEEEKAKTRQAQIEAALNSQEIERRRFARDLHDGFGQFISVLNLNFKALEQGKTNPTEIFEASSQVLDQMYRELKSICFNLMPETLIKQGIVAALREFSYRINRSGKIKVEIDTFGINERLPDLQEISIYRITQEWVNNILKYSEADKINVNLTGDEQEITLLIEDNGNGFDKHKLISGSGNGWKNMNSRANLIKGELELDSTQGVNGNTLILNIPISVAKKAPIAVI